MPASMQLLFRSMLYWIIGLLILKDYCVSGMKCDHCGKDFISLGRHTWRCQSRVTGPAHPAHRLPVQGGLDMVFEGQIDAGLLVNSSGDEGGSGLSTDLRTCVCGKMCKGRRGLSAHQRSCRAFHDLLG